MWRWPTVLAVAFCHPFVYVCVFVCPPPQTEDVFDRYSFKIGDTSGFSPYVGHGFVTQHKKPSAIRSRPLGATLQQPLAGGADAFSFCAIDGMKVFRGINLHFALQVCVCVCVCVFVC